MHESDDFIITRRIIRLSNLLVNKQHDELLKYNITFVQAEALLYFDKYEGMRALDLKQYLGVSHQAARSIVERMSKKEYLYSRVSAEDTRAKNIYLTDQGKQICFELRKVGIDDGQRLLKNIGSEKRRDLLRLLKQMIDNLE